MAASVPVLPQAVAGRPVAAFHIDNGFARGRFVRTITSAESSETAKGGGGEQAADKGGPWHARAGGRLAEA